MNLLDETGIIGCKPIDSLLIPNQKYSANIESDYIEATKYERLVGKLNCLTGT